MTANISEDNTVENLTVLKKTAYARQLLQVLTHSQISATFADIIGLIERAAINQSGGTDDLVNDLIKILLESQFKDKSSVSSVDAIIRRTIELQENNYLILLDKNSNIVKCNDSLAKVTGFNEQSELQGLSYEDFKCDAAMQAPKWIEQDKKVIEEKRLLCFLSCCFLKDGRPYLLLGEKNPIFDGETNKIIGVYSYAKNITHYNLVDISRFLIDPHKAHINNKLEKNQFAYEIAGEHNQYALSDKELEVLFFLLRGKTTKEIAMIVHRSPRTIETHLETIKDKLGVSSKSQLVEKAIFSGYMNLIPRTLFA